MRCQHEADSAVLANDLLYGEFSSLTFQTSPSISAEHRSVVIELSHLELSHLSTGTKRTFDVA